MITTGTIMYSSDWNWKLKCHNPWFFYIPLWCLNFVAYFNFITLWLKPVRSIDPAFFMTSLKHFSWFRVVSLRWRLERRWKHKFVCFFVIYYKKWYMNLLCLKVTTDNSVTNESVVSSWYMPITALAYFQIIKKD
jgi:hypothetical protein